VRVIVLSEYGITPVTRAVHLNRIFRQQGWLAIKEELGLELLDCGASKAFAVADHQVAHVYVNDSAMLPAVEKLLFSTPGVDRVLGTAEKRKMRVDHERAGDLIAVANQDAWFTYYYWLDDARAPDFARTVDIHRKPGYDPVELFLDPGLSTPKARIAWRLLQKKLGFRMLMDVIPLDASLVKGSHGGRPGSRSDWPLLMSPAPIASEIAATDVYHLIRRVVSAQ
jgi:predicted AlkP superfamily pyrophosphatase or phosphodiesterase